EFSGTEIDAVRAFAEATGREVTFSPLLREELAEALRRNTADMAIGRLTRAAIDERTAEWTTPVSSEEILVLARREDWYALADLLETARVGNGCGSPAAEALPGLAGSLPEVTDIPAAAQALLRDELDAVLCFRWQAEQIMGEYGSHLRCDSLPDTPMAECRFAVAKGDTELLEAWNRFLIESATGQSESPDDDGAAVLQPKVEPIAQNPKGW
ncbi:transporter substrate-binding domain-containing protein, partial [Ruminococcaceae bacterium OttesenSCG-928-L11]|nr:transporter substrate-binding domain-containing protein [Ruminococcaceae bacterium OttesenSCG-928-L11]